MYTIPRIESGRREQIEAQLDRLPAQSIGCCNWPESYPYAPQVTFRAAHDGSRLYIRYEVHEQVTRALEMCDGCRVCTDSCVEIFLRPSADDPYYYNFEFNAAGTLCASCRTGRPNPTPLTAEQLALVERYPSLGHEPFEERRGDNRWQLLVAIPACALFRHDVPSFSGRRMSMNLYKCGDALSQPHYLSWAPIPTPQPDFHRPEYFAEVFFQ